MSAWVALLVDPASTDIPRYVEAGSPVWVVDTPVNRVAVERSGWQGNVTLYQSKAPSDCMVNLASAVPLIEMHHGEYGGNPPYEELHVSGVARSSSAEALLKPYDLVVVRDTPVGFIAVKAEGL